MTASTSGWAVECTPPTFPDYGYTRPCNSQGHARAVLNGLPDHFLPARTTGPEARDEH